MPELEHKVVDLIKQVLDVTVAPNPVWIIRPGQLECGVHWDLVQRIYANLQPGMTLPAEMPPRERRTVDCVLMRPGQAPRIFEFDEKQHFNEYRAAGLCLYSAEIQVAFPVEKWLEACGEKKKLEAGGFARPRPPLFPGDNGRHRQRAFRDALSDLLPSLYGFLPTLRIADFEVKAWIDQDGARERLRTLLVERLQGYSSIPGRHWMAHKPHTSRDVACPA